MNTPNTNPDIASSVMNKIEAEQLEPRSKWWFAVRDGFFWLSWFLSAVVGALALAAIVFVVHSAKLGLFILSHDNFVSYVLDIMPGVWFLAFVAMCLLAYVNLRSTPRACRYPPALLIGANLAVTFVLAGLFFMIGLGRVIEQGVGKHLPFHEAIPRHEERVWSQPEGGLLYGEVKETNEPAGYFLLMTPNSDTWEVEAAYLSAQEWELVGQPAAQVKVIGEPLEAARFKACLVLPALFTRESGLVLPKERIFTEERNIYCKGVRPYERLEQFNLREL